MPRIPSAVKATILAEAQERYDTAKATMNRLHEDGAPAEKQWAAQARFRNAFEYLSDLTRGKSLTWRLAVTFHTAKVGA